jgi:hypothetical protein
LVLLGVIAAGAEPRRAQSRCGDDHLRVETANGIPGMARAGNAGWQFIELKK